MKEPRHINFDKPEDMAMSDMFVDTATATAVTSNRFMNTWGGDIYTTEGSILAHHIKTAKQVVKGDLTTLEEMLSNQALLLNNIFCQAANRSADNMNDYSKTANTYMNMALKAQSQCRCTVEAINEIKNPKSVTITKQANIADQQIVNNGNMNTGARAEKKATESNELLEEIEGDKLNTVVNRKVKTR